MKLPEEILLNDFKNWIETRYDDKFNQMIQFGKPIFHYPQQEHNFLSILTHPSQRKDYNRYMMDIKDYRNFYVHNPGVEVILEGATQKKFVLRKEYLNLARNRVSINKLFQSKKQYFIQPETMISADLNELVILLNDLWLPILKWMDRMYSNPDFSKYFKDFKRDNV